jgi:hypothetical protein
MTDRELWDAKPAPPHERLARIEGQTNFLSLLAGVEAGPDTTQDMGALSFSRSRGAIPEILECHVAQSRLFRLPLMSMVFDAVKVVLNPKESDYPWIRGAVADAYLLIRVGECKPYKVRAKRFRVGGETYAGMRKLAYSVLLEWLSRAERGWYSGLGRNSTESRHITHTGNAKALGHHIRPKLLPHGPDAMGGYEAKAVGMRDRLGWDDRNAAPSEVSAGTASAPLEQAKGKP